VPGMGLRVTGHSLGAAEAIIAMYDLSKHGYKIEQSYTFGQPRVGNKAFAKAFAEEIGASANYRVTYHKDPFVHMPLENMGFNHISTEVFYDGSTSEGHVVCDGSGEDDHGSDRYWDVPWMTLRCIASVDSCDHLHYLDGLNHIATSSSSCSAPGHADILV